MNRGKVDFEVVAPWDGWFVRDMDSSGPSIHYFQDGAKWAVCRDGAGRPLVKLVSKHEHVGIKRGEIPPDACERCEAVFSVLLLGR